MRRTTRWVLLPTTLALAASTLALTTGSTPAQAKAMSYDRLTKIQKHLLSGFASLELNGQDPGLANTTRLRNYQPRGHRAAACQQDLGRNVKVNANCENISDPDLAGRGQANNETSIAYDPNNTSNMIGSANDYRRGDGACYTSYTFDGGRSWADSTPPFSFTRGQTDAADFGAARQYWGGGGDTSVAYDTKGNAYLSCQVFNRGAGVTSNPDTSSALLLFRSTGNGGASWNFPGRYTRASADTQAKGIQPFLDKQLMTVDNKVGSPYQDRVYVSWTEFAADGSGFIYEAYSPDYGQTFSKPVLVSRNTSLCTVTYGAGTTATTGEKSNCNENQFSQPFTGPDGALYVAYANFNNSSSGGVHDSDGSENGDSAGTTPQPGDDAPPQDNHNQMLLAKSTDGGKTFSSPVLVGPYFDLPDCATSQNGKGAGRACVPEKGSTANSYFRATNYPSAAVNPTDARQVVVTYGSYINKHSNESNGCVPTGFSEYGANTYRGVKTAGACNNDILVSVSNNAGSSFTGTNTDARKQATVTDGRAQATTDQFWQWATFTPRGEFATSYYDRQYGSDETTGFSDISLSGSGDLNHYGMTRVTSSSMPPPTQFEGSFLGDYTGLTAPNQAFPLWSDTRNPELFVCPNTATTTKAPELCTAAASNASTANDQDIFTSGVLVPRH